MQKPKRKDLELELKAVVTFCYRYGFQFKGLCPFQKQGCCSISLKQCINKPSILMLLGGCKNVQ